MTINLIMGTHRHIRSTLLLALLLALSTVVTPWLGGAEAPAGEMHAAMSMDGDGHHPCHDAPVVDESAHCDERSCIFCGVAPFASTARIDGFVLLLSQVIPLTDPRIHHFEQPVELRPPQSVLPV